MFPILTDLLRELANYTYPACLLAILLCFSFLLIQEHGLSEKVKKLWKERKVIFLFFFYMAFLLITAVIGRSTRSPYGRFFDNMFFRADDASWNREIIENIFIFIPLTFLHLLSYPDRPHRPFRDALLLGFGTSLFIELSQLLFWLGAFQLSDLVYNTIGGILGFLLWMAYRRMRCLLRRKL